MQVKISAGGQTGTLTLYSIFSCFVWPSLKNNNCFSLELEKKLSYVKQPVRIKNIRPCIPWALWNHTFYVSGEIVPKTVSFSLSLSLTHTHIYIYGRSQDGWNLKAQSRVKGYHHEGNICKDTWVMTVRFLKAKILVKDKQLGSYKCWCSPHTTQMKMNKVDKWLCSLCQNCFGLPINTCMSAEAALKQRIELYESNQQHCQYLIEIWCDCVAGKISPLNLCMNYHVYL